MSGKDNVKYPGLKKKIIQTVAMTIACVVLGVVISLQYKTMNASEDFGQTATVTEYQSRIISLSDQLDLLKAENDQLREKIDTINSGTNEEQIAALQKELDDLKKFAGLSVVSGEGVHITISFPEEETVYREFYIMGIRHNAPCEGKECAYLYDIEVGDNLIFEKEPTNKEDSNAIRILMESGNMLGYVPRYYNSAVIERLDKGMTYSCKVIEVKRDQECSECVKVRLNIPKE